MVVVRRTGPLTPSTSWAEYSSRPTTYSRRQGLVIKDCFVLSEMLTICEQPVYGIVLMILHINRPCVLIRDQNSQIFQSPFKTSPMLRDIRAAFSLPVEHARHDTTDLHWSRTCWMVLGQWLRPQCHIWHGWPSTCWHVENKSPKYEVPIVTAQTCNHWWKSKGCASVPKNGFRIGVIEFYVSANNQKLTCDIMCHVCGFICYLCVELKLLINTSIEISAPIAAQLKLLALRSIRWGWSAATAQWGQGH